MSKPRPDYDPTDNDLITVIAANAKSAGFDAEEIRGILLAERANGILRANCPRWLRRTQYFLGLHDKLYPETIIARASADWLGHLEAIEPTTADPSPAAHRGAAD